MIPSTAKPLRHSYRSVMVSSVSAVLRRIRRSVSRAVAALVLRNRVAQAFRWLRLRYAHPVGGRRGRALPRTVDDHMVELEPSGGAVEVGEVPSGGAEVLVPSGGAVVFGVVEPSGGAVGEAEERPSGGAAVFGGCEVAAEAVAVEEVVVGHDPMVAESAGTDARHRMPVTKAPEVGTKTATGEDEVRFLCCFFVTLFRLLDM